MCRFRHALATLTGWVPLTLAGLIALPILYWLRQSYGLARHDGVLLVLTTGGLILVAVFALVVLLTALWLRVRPCPALDGVLHLDGLTRTETGYTPGWCHLNPLVRVEVDWEAPIGVEADLTGRGVERARASVRGQAGEVVRRVRISDVLGLTSIRFRQRFGQRVRIVPDPGRVQGQALRQQVIPGDEQCHPEGQPVGDYLEIRRYAPGDPLKQVLWKPYARSGQLLVRTPERAIAASRRTLAYFVAGPADEPSAGVARALLEGGALGQEFLFAADGETALVSTPADAVEQVIRSVTARERGGEGLADFLGRGEARGLTACVLFVPSRPGVWLRRVAEQIARFRGPFRVLVGIDGLREGPGTGRLRHWLFRPAEDRRGKPGGSPTRPQLREVHDALRAAGADVHIIQRTTGQVVPQTEF